MILHGNCLDVLRKLPVPFAGTGTVGIVALRHGRRFVGVELKPEYIEMAHRRIRGDNPLFNREASDLTALISGAYGEGITA
ncbi:MAG TPA: DNA methyltransferase [Acidobacteriaceae bacterium]|jgi:hypothetical protein|nr:DNA methyltransferase [Acidobacteriaceae bacterium]